MTEPEQAKSQSAARSKSGAALTLALWAIGVGLQFAVPLLRDRVTLSDDLYVGSFLAPWWTFLQVLLLAGLLAMFRRRSEGWSNTGRITFAVVGALLFSLLESNLLTTLLGQGVPLADDPVRVALMWSTPLAFYGVPAGLVIFSWIRRDPRFTLPRALGTGLVFIGIASFAYVVWLGHLWELYYRPFGAGSV